MLRIILCDDEPAWLTLLEAMVADWAKSRGVEVKIDLCGNADQFFFVWEEKKDADIAVLDIDMPGMDGMELAHRLRDMGEELQIIFITGFTEHALEGYEVDALAYLAKPVTQDRLSGCLDKAANRCGRRAPELLVPVAEGVVRVKLEELCYLESMGHDTILYCRNRTEPVRCRTGISQMERRLGEQSDSFFRLHRSLLINLSGVERIGRKEVLMENGELLPVPRGRWKELNQAYLNYYRGWREV